MAAAKKFEDLTCESAFAKALTDKLFYSVVQPTPLPNPKLIAFNTAFASTELNYQFEEKEEENPQADGNSSSVSEKQQIVEYLSGAKLFPGDNVKPISMCYSGHQFGYWAGQLGDGRAIMLGGT